MQLIRLPDELRHAILALTSPLTKEQSKGAVVIMKHVEAELQGFSGKDLPENVQKIIQALVCKLTSNKKEGISTGLHTILKQKDQTVEFTYETLKTEFDGKVTRDDEVYDVLVSEILGYSALVRSGHLGKHPEVLKDTVVRLLALKEGGEAIDIMRTTLVMDILERYSDSPVHDIALEQLKTLANVPMKKIKPSLLWIRLVLMKKCSDMPNWLSSTLDASNYTALGEVLKTCKALLPKVHPLVEELASALARSGTNTKFPLGEFWRITFYSRLHSLSSEDLQLALIFLKILIPKLKRKSEVKTILGEKVITFLLKNANSNKVLKAALPDLSRVLEHLVQNHEDKEEEVQLAVVEALILPPGTIQFDSLTKTNMVQRTIKHLTASDVKKLGDYITKRIIGKDDQEGMYAEVLALLLMNPKIKEDVPWKTEQLKTLIKATLVTQKKKISYLRNTMMQGLYQELQRAPSALAFLKPIVDFTHKEIDACTEDNGLISPQSKELWDNIKKKIATLNSKQGKWPKNSNQVLKVLYYAMTFYVMQDFIGASKLLEKLDDCLDVAQKQGSKQASKEELPWVVTATELILNYAPGDSTFIRAVAQSAFKLIVHDQTSETISMLVDAIVPEGMEEQDVESDEEEEKEEEDEDEDEEMSEDNDDEKNEEDGKGENEGDPLDEIDIGGEEDMDDDQDDESDEDESAAAKDMTAKLRLELALAQGEHEDIDLDEAAEDELEKLDIAMSAIFAKYRGTKKGKKEPKKKLRDIHLECRAYDLLEVYIEQHPSMGFTLGLVRPLLVTLNSLATTNEKGEKKNDTRIMRLRKLLDVLGEVQSFEKVDMNILEMSEELETFVTSTIDYKFALSRYIANCHTLMIKCSLQILGETAHRSNPIIDLFSEHLFFMLNKKEPEKKILMYTGACSLDWGALWKLVKDMVDFTFEKNNKYFGRTNGLCVLSLLLKNKALFSRATTAEVKQLGESVSQCLLGILKKFNLRQQARFVSRLFEFMIVLRENHRDPDTSGIRWEEILVAVRDLDKAIPTASRSPLRVYYKELVRALHRDPNQQAAEPEGKKRKFEEEEERRTQNKRRKELARKKQQKKKAKAQALQKGPKKFLGNKGKVKRKRASQKKRTRRSEA
ncbi:myb-binding protein 1A-like protein [Penaeus chinensis]|uniref:myb-binding protein 1A-like protein n=1 Tax=Penaeus chinensis TaxID=139456 RepID=UPI001FB5D1D1|nr:myb-binding protein 1A-like protein [Penaeus chinensis]